MTNTDMRHLAYFKVKSQSLGLLLGKPIQRPERPPAGAVRKCGDGVPAQVSSSSSDRGSKLRGQSQNSPRVASKRDVNITKLNHI
ncbi:hypothetical protein AVEN_63142-1 [Araneus ventricosus]|uniref:Uncharacterized protein n=1 Tax=Araneus ventricosus TaxID=182803 RepID=A0A4Y2B0Z1_ARAVE|nr:hypothetical protein AVEN_63142-1 [Araneus ventricosus]